MSAWRALPRRARARVCRCRSVVRSGCADKSNAPGGLLSEPSGRIEREWVWEDWKGPTIVLALNQHLTLKVSARDVIELRFAAEPVTHTI
jgi:hypothetical protein